MCGRYTLTVDPSELMTRFELETADLQIAPRYNIAPTQTVAVSYDESARTLSGARWGLVPSWAKDIAIGYKMINARSETLNEKPSFRTLLKKRRCLIYADGFYEWQRQPDGSKIPMRFVVDDGKAFAFAGLWDIWKTPQGDWLRTCTIITCAPNSVAAPVHDRMPAILATRQAERDWLNKADDDAEFLQSILQPYPDAHMRRYVVSARVGNVKNEGPELIERSTAE
jgi:putative SOS response-associated peptidase YedK